MTVFVAGASGAVGRPMIPRLRAAGHAVVAMTRDRAKAESLERAGADAVVCDVFDAPGLTAAVRSAAPSAIIHQLTDLPPAMNPRQLKTIYERNNRVRREGTANLLAAARAAGVSRFIVQSMATWYRPDDPGVERGLAVEGDALWTDAPEPIGEAVRTVAEMEAAVLRDAPLGIVLRYGAFYGPGTWYAADGDIARRVRKRQLPIVGAGRGVTSFIHVDDAASAAVAALDATARYLGLGLASVINALDPARVFVGGEITLAWDLIEGTVRAAVAERTLTPAAAGTEIRPVAASEHPRLQGAAALVAAPAFAAPVVA